MTQLKEGQTFADWASEFATRKEDREVKYLMSILAHTADDDQIVRLSRVLNRELTRLGDSSPDPDPIETPTEKPKDWSHWTNWSMYGDEEEAKGQG